MPTRNLTIALLCGLILSSACLAQAPGKLTVEAGTFDRHDSIVPFTVPQGTPSFSLIAHDGSMAAVQVLGTHAWFVLDSLKANSARTYKVQPLAPGTGEAPPLALAREKSTLKVSAHGQLILQYNGEKTALPPGIPPEYQRGGYIHPVFTPAGKLLTDDYVPDHKHHHGIWSPWTKTEFEGRHPDFWNMGHKTGRVDFDSLGDSFCGPVCAGFTTNHKFIDMTVNPEKAALTEVWDVTIYRPTTGKKPLLIFDLTTTQNAIDSPLTLVKYHYGGLGFRGRRDWKGKEGITFLTSEGHDRKTGNETRGRWCWCGGEADGGTIGITIMDHPGNFRSPQPMRLNPDEPFFCYCPSQLGDWSIEKGKPYVARYRFVAADGPADVEAINRLWNDYAQPPKVTLE